MQKKVLIYIFKKTMRGYEFLLLRRPKEHGDIWQPITGHIEKGEKPVEAAKREVKEETGLTDFIREVDPELIQKFKSNNRQYEEHSFGFEVPQDTEEIKLSKEHRSFSWVNKDTAKALLFWPQNIEALDVICDKMLIE